MAPKELPLRTGDTVPRDRPSPSALGPLQALCASDVRGFLSRPFGQTGHRHGPFHFLWGTSSSITLFLRFFVGPYSVLSTDTSIGHHAKRKRSWSRAVFSNLQRKGLEKRFEVQKYVTKPDRRQLAAMLGLTDAQVKVWFQNRRMKWRHAQQQKESENKKDPSNAEGVLEKEKEKEVMSDSSSSEAEIDATDDEEVADIKTPEEHIKMETQNIS
ncbi:hypothetical protein ACJMK2_036955 [Sinanodonta woodiana]|uniref:Homeobox domain-containing protein n=1 Tax=Sinanodonta woodiana TaxID=1069815 RepID=A0ABD3WIS2_SINWO